MSFSAFKLHPKIAAGIQALGYKTPTPIQVQAIPPVLAGKDVMGLAQTGTGKTAAFVPARFCSVCFRVPAADAQPHHSADTRTGRTDPRTLSANSAGTRGIEQHDGLRRGRRDPQVSGLRAASRSWWPAPGGCSTTCSTAPSRRRAWTSSSSTRRTVCSTWAFCPISARYIKQLRLAPADLALLSHHARRYPQARRTRLRSPVTVQVDHTVPLATVSHALYPVVEHLKIRAADQDSWRRPASNRADLHAYQAPRQAPGPAADDAGPDATSLQGNLSQNRRKAALEGFREGKFNSHGGHGHRSRGIDISQIPRDQLRHARYDRGLHPPHRPHGPRRKDRRRLHLRHPRGRALVRTSSAPWAIRSSAAH